MAIGLPDNLSGLHTQEQELRERALDFIRRDLFLPLHLDIIEGAMNLADVLRQYPTDDEDLKIIQVLAIRSFNAFGAGLKLALSGYFQNSALVMRDILETVFLLDLFRGDRTLIEQWRFADKKAQKEKFSPAAVRKALDARNGDTQKKREALYKDFSELAGHPSMKSVFMLRPKIGGDAFIGPFIEKTGLDTILFEMGRLAAQVGQTLNEFFPTDYPASQEPRADFSKLWHQWVSTFHSNSS